MEIQHKKNFKKIYAVGIGRSCYTPCIVEATSEEEAESLAMEMENDSEFIDDIHVETGTTERDETYFGEDILLLREENSTHVNV